MELVGRFDLITNPRSFSFSWIAGVVQTDAESVIRICLISPTKVRPLLDFLLFGTFGPPTGLADPFTRCPSGVKSCRSNSSMHKLMASICR